MKIKKLRKYKPKHLRKSKKSYAKFVRNYTLIVGAINVTIAFLKHTAPTLIDYLKHFAK